MFLIVTRSFPPEVGGMQVLMGGLSEELIEHGPVKVFADEFTNSNIYDDKSSLNIERIKGIKFFRKYRKASIVNDFINTNSNIRAIIVDHWKSLELLKTKYLNKTKTFCLLHSKEINHKIGSSLNKRIIKSTNKANFIIANSNFTKNLAINMGIDSSKIHVIFPGINKPKKIENKYILEGIRNKSDLAIKANFKFSSILFKKITSFSRDNSFNNFVNLFSSSPKPIQTYLILGNLDFKFLIAIKILS